MQTTLSKEFAPRSLWQRWRWLIWVAIIIAIYAWAIGGLQFSGLQSSAKTVSDSIVKGLLHPDWAYVYNGSGEDLSSLTIQTLAIAFLGTIVSAVISVPFAFWAARTAHERFYLRSGSGRSS
jgi:ABC-type phosphate/phosphonate transport system, permease component